MHYVRDDLDDIDENGIGEKKRFALLDLLLELSRNGAKLTDQEIRKEVDTIMFEGHDTTAAGSSFVLCVLGIHQDIQERVFEQVNEIFGESNRPCTFQDTLEMKYLERVIYETLRLFPPVPAIARHLNNDVKIVTKLFITKRLYDFDYRVYRLKEFYPNPDNFLPEEMQNRHYFSFIPFSAGSRSCVGRKYIEVKGFIVDDPAELQDPVGSHRKGLPAEGFRLPNKNRATKQKQSGGSRLNEVLIDDSYYIINVNSNNMFKISAHIFVSNIKWIII